MDFFDLMDLNGFLMDFIGLKKIPVVLIQPTLAIVGILCRCLHICSHLHFCQVENAAQKASCMLQLEKEKNNARCNLV